ncbi:hypothetical protein B0H21DRAFT_42778 [Amylocystis lapponica]|nr:hypothetical protein B0H21DRAFT_42778 [Amylocystis lapponica]
MCGGTVAIATAARLGQSAAVYQFMEKPCVEQESLKSVAPPFVLENKASEPLAQPVPAEMPFAAFRRASVGSPVATPTSTILSVPALRIVKKTWKVHGRTDSATSTGSTESSLSSSAGSSTSSSSTSSSQASKTEVRVFSAKSSSTTKVESAKQDTENDHLLVPAPARTTIRGVQRPPVMPQVSSTAAEEAARRFAAAGIQRPNPQHPVQLAPMPHRARPDARVQVGVGFASRLAPQRSASVAPTTVRPASGSISKAGGSLLRAPTRYGSVGAAAGASALPRPASRMPAQLASREAFSELHS